MHFIDIILGVLLLWGTVRGFFKGFLMEVASLVALVAAIYGAIYFSHFAGQILRDVVDWDAQYIDWASYALTFILIVLVIVYIGKLLTKLIKLVALNMFNRLLGGAFAFIKTAFLCSVLIMFLNTLETNLLIKEDALQKSLIYPYVQPLAPYLLPEILETGKKLDTTIQREVFNNA